MAEPQKNIMIVAGEVSGDLLGASLIKEMKAIDPSLEICGIGGDKMKEAGVEIIYHISRMAFLGFAEVVRHIPFIRKVQKDLLAIIDERNIGNIILIDYPGFNLNFAKKIKAKNIKVFYYVSPQIWAWGAGRIKKIKSRVDKMIVVFPFEEAFYKNAGVDAEFVGHPLLERISGYNFLSKEEFYKKFYLDESKEILLMLPGSRSHEVKKIFPEAIKAAERIADEFNMQIVVAGSKNVDEALLTGYQNKYSFNIISGYTYDLMNLAKVGIIKSGTSTLEAGVLELPMVIVYKTSWLTYIIGKSLIKVKNIGMANIIAEENVAPELIQYDVNENSIYTEVKNILRSPEVYKNIKSKLKEIKLKLGSPGASKRAAKIIHASLK